MKKKYKWYDNKHNRHPVEARLRADTIHHAELRCVKCDKWIKWLSKQEYNLIIEDNKYNYERI